MEIRGNRVCRSCGTRWSYFETGDIACPDCGSVRSVGTDDERRLHTATTDALDLSAARSAAAEGHLETAARRGAEAAGEFTRSHGFVDAGRLRPLDEQFVAAVELRHACVLLATDRRPADEEERYVLALLRGADEGERPAAVDVPPSARPVRGLAAAEAVDAYRRDVNRWREATEPDLPREVTRLLGRLGDHRKRIAALDGDVEPADADALVDASRALGEYLVATVSGAEPTDTDEGALDVTRAHLDALEP